MKKKVGIIFFIFPIILFANQLSIKGQFWLSGLTGNDIPKNQSAYETMVGYIPTVSLLKTISNQSFIDLEFAYRFDKSFSGDSLTLRNEKFHRSWIRYSSETIEARLGLQKIVFGPSQILRALSWFDTFNVADPTGQTDGVDAFRLRWFPNNSLALWSWLIQEKNELSLGGRAEFSTTLGEIGITFHHDAETHDRMIGQYMVQVTGPNQRAGIDVRYDGIIGFWNESVMVFLEDQDLSLMTFGADYTLPFFSGILVSGEIFMMKNYSTKSEKTQSALMVNVPLGMIHNVMWISQTDLGSIHFYHYLRWNMTFDRYSINIMLSKNPKRTDYFMPADYLPQTVAGFGSGINLMFIYNH